MMSLHSFKRNDASQMGPLWPAEKDRGQPGRLFMPRVLMPGAESCRRLPLTYRILGVVVLLLVFGGCATLPHDVDRPASVAMTDTDTTRMCMRLTPLLAGHKDLSAFHPLESGLDAFLARIVLADTAERSLDVQYYIWRNDETGLVLADRLLRAADRGVRVRLLLDDYGAPVGDEALAVLHHHPNIEVRLFNPFGNRAFRWLEFLRRYGSLNRRMHNKSYTVDNQVTIVGGRNVGNEYFQAGLDVNFGDLDVLAFGPVVQEVSTAFDRYWNDARSYPISALSSWKASPEHLDKARTFLQEHARSVGESQYGDALRNSTLAQNMEAGSLLLFWGRAWAVYDDPDKVSADPDDPSQNLLSQIRYSVCRPTAEMVVVSPYFVPGDDGVAYFKTMIQEGVRVVILTNSLASTDVFAVHSGYARYRKALLDAGVELYELHPVEHSQRHWKMNPFHGASRSSLHAKTFIIDRQTVFVGSLNLDPRSVSLNTEIGIIMESQDMARIMVEAILEELPERAFRLQRTEAWPGLQWVTREDGQEVRLNAEPESSFWRNLGVLLVSLLPIESQL